ncbi:MBL fold metallo-hydrolase [Flammeovirga aprica]|uniref:MBL fold metallo-hydrolase n=1 Tax=Flammeovirga aprica JL-4 TaxID=694437 RepID=A0A7X9XD77_9BACT|nr:MBL fold metallo-hydrolase [Flammeovirga aprica]NME72508.1 MBL fold metallo-hydrolase [Flammeovirga aprica JL-4]
MKIEQIYTGCLAQGAYYIESNGEAAIVDPLRETKPYIEKAEKDGTRIKYIFETHFHADFVSGHVSLAEKTGAEIVFGPTAKTTYDAHIATDNEEFKIGDIIIKVLHTPGHTQESSTFLVIDEEGKDHAVFSGDTLFIGDVGRPDLAVKSDLSREDLAEMLFDSLRNKIMPLHDEVIVYPAHGAGSACGKNMSKETFDSLGNQKKTNYALRADMSKEEFVKEVTEGLTTPPQYFPQNVKMNKEGYENIDLILEKGTVALAPQLFEDIVNAEGALVLDTRDPQVFKDAFIPNSINIGVNGGFAPWVGALVLDLMQPIVIVAEEGKEEEVITRLSRVGYDNTLGYLEGGIEAWKKAGKEVDTIVSISAEELKGRLSGEITVIDARKDGEYKSEHIDSDKVVHKALDYINTEWSDLDRSKTYHIHCAGGYRSMIASSILKSRGFENIIDVKGGFKAIKEAGIKTTAFVCPSTL